MPRSPIAATTCLKSSIEAFCFIEQVDELLGRDAVDGDDPMDGTLGEDVVDNVVVV